MKIRNILTFCTSLFILFVVVGCADYPPEESTQEFQVIAQPVNGDDIRLILVTSGKIDVGEKEKEIRSKLESIINSGKYNIVSIKTHYLSGYLTTANITYDSSGPGEGNKLRALFIIYSGNKKYYHVNYLNEKVADITNRLNEAVNKGKYNIRKIQTIYVQKYLLAAEIYYWEKS